MKIEKNSTGDNFINISSETHKKIVKVYSAKMLGSKILYLGLTLIIDVVTSVLAIMNIPRAEANITTKESAIIIGIATLILAVNFIMVSEYIIIPKNIKKKRIKCLRGNITGKKAFNGSSDRNNEFLRYEIYVDNDSFRLACADEYNYISKTTDVNFIYVKPAIGRRYIPLIAYLPDETGLDYEMLNSPEFSYEQFKYGETSEDNTDLIDLAMCYRDEIENSKTKAILELEKELEKAPAGSKKQVKIMEKIGAERHKIKKANARKNRWNKLKEIIAIIKR